jgi:hypothetical protein
MIPFPSGFTIQMFEFLISARYAMCATYLILLDLISVATFIHFPVVPNLEHKAPFWGFCDHTYNQTRGRTHLDE